MSNAYHFIGIGGIGMSGLAKILLSKNVSVSGSDIVVNNTVEGLIKAGAVIHKGHSSDIIHPNMTVVYSTDIKPDNPEYLAAIKHQCKMLHRSDLLANLIEHSRSLAVAGTHGKTTTSALLSTVLVEARLDPSFAVGGMLPEFHANARFGQGDLFAFEADESDRSFLKYYPYGAIVTNIDNDHLCNYEGKESVLIQAFKQFMLQVKNCDFLFWCNEDIHLRALNPKGKSYGFDKNCDWRVYNITQSGFNLIFDIEGEGKTYQRVELARIGEFNALNALAVFALAISLGVDEQFIRRAFKSFKGVMRRCEFKGEINKITFIDDYGHHPTEIKVTIDALRKAIGERRLIVVFQPHRYSRTQDCLGMYGGIFDAADELIVTDIFAAGEVPIANVSSQNIIEEVKIGSSISLQYVARSALNHFIAQFVQPHDVVLTLGAGDITKVGPETLSLLEQQSPRKLKIGLVFGGSKTEHEVSIRSANHFSESLSPSLYQVENFGITKLGSWVTGDDAKVKLERILERKMDDPHHFVNQETIAKLNTIDVFIPSLHGPMGEDGMIQGFFEIFNKAYVGCDHRSSAVCMDKIFSKKIAVFHNIQTSTFVDFSIYEWESQKEALLDKIKKLLVYPLFVKPSHLGSSVGVKKVYEYKELETAINEAFSFDTHILVENGIVGREIEFAVLGNDKITVFDPGEILTGGAVYDYAGKYSSNGIKTDSKAKISEMEISKGKELAERIYRSLGCTGLARVDFFLSENGEYWFNEINSMPGFTSISLYPQMCLNGGLNGTELIDKLIIFALHKKRRHDRMMRGKRG